MSAFLDVKNLEIRYGSTGNIVAVKGIDIEVPKGKIVAILGANGAGKSSTLRAITGLVQPSAGKIMFDGKDITHLPAEKIVSLSIAHSPEGRQIFPDLTVHENMMVGAFTLKSKKRISELLDSNYSLFPRLKERSQQIAGTLSGGEQQMLAIARALMSSPKLLILDEPSLGLAPLIVRDILQMIKHINSTGTTVLIVEQNALQTLKVADYAYVLATGTVSVHGNAAQLLSDEKLVNAYLGK